jgi:prepilin peptidase CpaA
MLVIDAARLLLFPAVMAFAASSDLLTMTISNRISIILVLGFAVLAPITGISVETMAWHFLSGMIVLALGLICYARGWVGGGDVKLAALVAMWLGISLLPDFLLLASIFGGALTMLILSFRSMPLPGTLVRLPWLARLHEATEGVPYGIALALAALVIYPSTIWMKAVVG